MMHMSSQESQDARWDIHTNRQISAAKGGALAVTVLNSGSWLALLSQVGNLKGYDTGWPILAWGTGAFLGTAIWIFIYRGTVLQGNHEFDRENDMLRSKLDWNIIYGFVSAIASLIFFILGVVMLTFALL